MAVEIVESGVTASGDLAFRCRARKDDDATAFTFVCAPALDIPQEQYARNIRAELQRLADEIVPPNPTPEIVGALPFEA